MFITLIIVLSCFAVLFAGIIIFSNVVDRIDKKKHAADKLITLKTKSRGLVGSIEAPYKAFESAVKSYVSTHRKPLDGLTGMFRTTGYVGTTGIAGSRRNIFGSTGMNCVGKREYVGTTGIGGVAGFSCNICGSTGMNCVGKIQEPPDYGCNGTPRNVQPPPGRIINE